MMMIMTLMTMMMIIIMLMIMMMGRGSWWWEIKIQEVWAAALRSWMLHTAKGKRGDTSNFSGKWQAVSYRNDKQRMMIMIMMMALVMTMCGQLGMVGISMLIAPRTDRPLASFCRLTKPTHWNPWNYFGFLTYFGAGINFNLYGKKKGTMHRAANDQARPDRSTSGSLGFGVG